MSKNKPFKFEDSILFAEGWTEEEFKRFYYNHLNFKIANNIRLNPQETKDFIALGEENGEDRSKLD